MLIDRMKNGLENLKVGYLQLGCLAKIIIITIIIEENCYANDDDDFIKTVSQIIKLLNFDELYQKVFLFT